MEVKCYYSGEDYDSAMEMYVDDKFVFSVYSMGECPEDANLVRDLSFVHNIPD